MSPADSPVLLSIEGAVATITLNRPEALNAITVEMLDGLGSMLARLHDRPEIAVVVITGAGRAFSAGVDLKALAGRSLDGGAVGDLLDIPGRRVIELIEMLDAIVIAKVNGFCFTGALELALACDLIVAADEAVLGDTHAKWGIRPSWGMSQRLPALVGPAKARLLSYSAATFTGAQAQEYGIAALSSPKAELDATVAGLARDIAANSHGALMAYKDLYRAAQRLTVPEGLAYEAVTAYPIDDTEERIAEFR
jgi:enoyl-CoA hydratase/carnithine racemase